MILTLLMAFFVNEQRSVKKKSKPRKLEARRNKNLHRIYYHVYESEEVLYPQKIVVY